MICQSIDDHNKTGYTMNYHLNFETSFIFFVYSITGIASCILTNLSLRQGITVFYKIKTPSAGTCFNCGPFRSALILSETENTAAIPLPCIEKKLKLTANPDQSYERIHMLMPTRSQTTILLKKLTIKAIDTHISFCHFNALQQYRQY